MKFRKQISKLSTRDQTFYCQNQTLLLGLVLVNNHIRMEKAESLNIVRIRPAASKDKAGLKVLYRRLDSCNGSEDTVGASIAATRRSLQDENFERFTLVAEVLDEDGGVVDMAATGSLILLGEQDPSEIPIMYYETKEGLEQGSRKSGAAVDMAGMVTKEEWERRGIGKAVTAVRAIVARKYAGTIGTDTMLTEFLPGYDNPETKENAFWRDLILPRLMETGELMTEAQHLSNQPVSTIPELLGVLLKLGAKDRNKIVKKYFPHKILGSQISAEARAVLGDVGQKTKGALVNLQRMYGSGMFTRTGAFPIDGGQNYEAPVAYGALGDKSVVTAYSDGGAEDERIMAESRQQVVVSTPRANRKEDLRGATWYLTPAIAAGRAIKLPKIVAELTHVAPGGQTSYYELPRSSKR